MDVKYGKMTEECVKIFHRADISASKIQNQKQKHYNLKNYNIGKEEDIWHRFMHRKQMKFRNMRQSMRMKYVIWPGNVWSFWRMTVYYHFQIR